MRALLTLLIWSVLSFSAFAQNTTSPEPEDVIEETLKSLRANPNNTSERNAELDALLAQHQRLQRQAPPTIIPTASNEPERITSFDVLIEVEESGALIVTETIDIIASGQDIRRGIFRELPRYYDFMGVRLENDYQFLSIKRNAENEPRSIFTEGNATTVRIGSGSVFLPNGPHQYEIRYRIPEQVRRHRDDNSGGDRDEVYWNATGTYWTFPIERATATVIFPEGAQIIDESAYIGRFGTNDQSYQARIDGNRVTFETTRPLNRREGLSISATINPGLIEPMSAARVRELAWIRTGGPILLGLGGLGLFIYYFMMWSRVGRDPVKPPVFPRYAPPKGYSPAAVHYIHHKGFHKMDALTATLMNLSMKDALDIHAEKKKTTLTYTLANRNNPELLKDERKLLDLFFPNHRGKIVMDKKTNTSFYQKVKSFTRYISEHYGRNYHRSNAGWGILGIVLSIIILIIVFNQPVSRSGPLFAGIILAIAAMNILFFVLLRAPTKKGAQISSEIDGLKLYLETAEKVRIDTANPIGERPPLMTVELYERFMPYAVALGVEKPWTKQFENTLPREAKEYQPSYAHGSLIDSKGGVPWKMSDALATAMTAGVAAAAPVSQSSSSGGFSSGGGGGGFSGGGGGGGGGGGW